MKLYDI